MKTSILKTCTALLHDQMITKIEMTNMVRKLSSTTGKARLRWRHKAIACPVCIVISARTAWSTIRRLEVPRNRYRFVDVTIGLHVDVFRYPVLVFVGFVTMADAVEEINHQSYEKWKDNNWYTDTVDRCVSLSSYKEIFITMMHHPPLLSLSLSKKRKT